jgi:GNAT superfamily N-acetyltransferase
MASRHFWAFERGTLWTMDLRDQAVAPVKPHLAVTFGEVRLDAAGMLAVAMELASPEPVRRRFASGRRCFVAWVAGAITSYGWVSQGAECIGELERPIRMLEGEAYLWDCATLPPYRRKRLYSALLGHVAAALRTEGLQRLWIGASLGNQPSIQGFAAARFQPAAKFTYVRLLNARCLRMEGYPTASPTLIAAARSALLPP